MRLALLPLTCLSPLAHVGRARDASIGEPDEDQTEDEEDRTDDVKGLEAVIEDGIGRRGRAVVRVRDIQGLEPINRGGVGMRLAADGFRLWCLPQQCMRQRWWWWQHPCRSVQ